MKNRKFWISLIAGILAAVMLLSLLVGLLPTRASAASSSEIREQINDLEDQRDELQAQMDELQQLMSDNLSEMQQIVEQKGLIDQQVFLLNEEIENINEQIGAYRVLIADKQDELDAAQAQYTELSDRYRERVRAMEEEGTLSYWSVLFKANSFADLLDRLNMIEEIAASDQRRLQELNDAAQKVTQAQAELEAGKAELEQTRAELDASQAELEQKRAEADALLAQLVAQGTEYEQRMEESEAKQDELLDMIAQKEDEFDKASYQEWLATYVPPTTAAPTYSTTPVSSSSSTSTSIPVSSGDWMTPVPYYTLTSPFGMRLHPILGIYRMHQGVDLSCAQGTSIYASRGGQVTIATYDSEAGFYVKINHGDGYCSVYMHMTNYIVSVGDYVAQGQVIGYVGSTGLATGPHLHFGISYNGTYVNPMDYI